MVTSSKPEKVKPPTYHRIELSRGWRVLRQYVNLRVDLENRSISGSTTISLCVLNSSCCKIALNLRRCAVTSVRVNSRPCAFELISPLDDEQFLESVSSENSRHRIRNVDFSLSKREDEARKCPELLVSIPSEVSADCITERNRLWDRCNAGTKVNSETSKKTPPPLPIYELPLLHIDIEYSVLDPNAGAVFYGNLADETRVRDPLYMLTDNRSGMARFWMPCVDSPNWCDRYLFDIDITVNPNLTAVSSGELSRTTVMSVASNSESCPQFLKTFEFRGDIPAHASEVVVAVGPFVVLPDPNFSNTVTHFCLPGHAHELVHTGPVLFAKAFMFCKDYFGSDPPSSSVKQLFLGTFGQRADVSMTGAGGVIVHSGDILHTDRCIDEGLLAREAIMNAVVQMYFGRFLRPRTSEDGWLILGLAAHISSLGLQAILGRNWYKYHIHSLMEELRKERSCDLSSSVVDRLFGEKLESVRRRSHVILYMIEKRLGGDVIKRAMRDIIAEGKRAVISSVKNCEKSLTRPVIVDEFGEIAQKARLVPDERELRDLCRGPNSQNAPNGAVSSGFDEAVQGVAVGPFLKRLRAICGTDVRSMVRLWASSPGIPRMQVGYQYNPRKHTIEVVVKQDPPTDLNDIGSSQRPTLRFHGSIGLRVMEAEGAYDHTLEISDLIFATEVPCHSRRKGGKGSNAEEVNPNAVTQASPLSWIRFDPENEWCKEMTFKQHESSWAAVLEGERDCIGQLEACRGLEGFSTEQSAQRLLTILKDGQAYWKVRAEAAAVLASNTDGLEMLINYFRSCYTEGDEDGARHLRTSNFSNMANYYVKRAMLKAIANARVKGLSSLSQPNGSVPLAASQFLCFVLAGHDNAGNDYDDDHYIVDLLECLTSVAIDCIGDDRHASAGEGGCSTTDNIIRHLEQFRSIERMVQRRTSLVSCALAMALGRIETGKLIHQDKLSSGMVSKSLREGMHSPNIMVMKGLFGACQRGNRMDERISAFLSLTEMYGGNPSVAQWVLCHADRTSSNTDLIALRHNISKSEGGRNQNESFQVVTASYDYCESPMFRYRLMDSLVKAATVKDWYGNSSPFLLSIRSPSRCSIDFCLRLHRLIVGDGDSRVRSSALRLAKLVWGVGIPPCLMSQREYEEARRLPMMTDINLQDIVQMRSHGAGVAVEAFDTVHDRLKSKSGKGKGVKNGKSKSKSKKKSANRAEPVLLDPPQSQPEVQIVDSTVRGDPTAIDVPVLSSEAKVKNRPKRNITIPLPSEPSSQPATKNPLPPSRPMLKSVPVSAMKPPLQPTPASSSKLIVQRTPSISTPPTPKLSLTPWSKPSSKSNSSTTSNPTPKQNTNIIEPVSKEQEKEVSIKAQKGLDLGQKPTAPTGRISIPRSVPVDKVDKRRAPAVDRSLLRSVPVKRDVTNIHFSWHPLDAEDARFLERAWQEERSNKRLSPGLNLKSKPVPIPASESGLSKLYDDGSGDAKIQPRSRDEWDRGHDAKRRDLNDEVEHIEDDGDRGSSDHKKKKKKKRRREHEEDDDHRRKKKKKKKRKESGGYEESDRMSEGRSHHNERMDGHGRREELKIGKMKIKLPTLSSSANELASAD